MANVDPVQTYAFVGPIPREGGTRAMENIEAEFLRLYQALNLSVAQGNAIGTGSVFGPAASVSGEIALYSGVTGKLLTRATGTGVVHATAGVYSVSKVVLTAGAEVSGVLAVGNGGTGITTYAVGDLLYASASGTLSKLADVATGNALISGGVTTAPLWGKIGLTTHVTGTLAVGNGGTGLTSGTSGGILGFTGTTTLASSVLLTLHAIVIGGGAGATPTPLASLGTATTVLHGNAAGDPTFGAVALASDVSGTLPVANGGTNITSYTIGDLLYASASGVLSKLADVAAGSYLRSGGVTTAPVWSTVTIPNTAAVGDVWYGSASNTITALTKDTNATRYLANTGTSNIPKWDQVNLTNGVTGTLPLGNGGTGLTAVPGADTRVIFNDGGVYGADSLFTYIKGTSGLVVGSAGAGSGSVATGIVVSNSPGGLYKFLDPTATAYLQLAMNSALTTNRSLTLVTGDANRTITLSGDPTLADWFNQSVKSGSSPTFTGTNITGLLPAGVSFAATQRVLGRNTAGAGVGQEVTASQVVDWIGSTQGDLLYRDAAAWAVLAPGTAGQLLQSGGAAANPSWGDYGLTHTVAYAAGNFTASAGTWTVDLADQVVFQYARVGLNLLYVTFFLNATSVSATPVTLNITIPGGFTGTGGTGTLAVANDAGVGVTGAYIQISGTTIQLVKLAAAAWSTATNTTTVMGSILIFI